MKGRVFFVLFFICILFKGFASETNFGIIPEKLLVNANAILRYYNVDVNIISQTAYTKSVKYAITILNPNADDLAHLTFYYDNTNILGMIHGKIFDKNGKLIRKITAKEIKDRSYLSESTVLGDGRLKYVEIYNTTYPFTVQFEYSISYNGFVTLPDWSPLWDYNVSIEESKYTLKSNLDFKFHYKEQNLPNGPIVDSSDKTITHTWKLENFQAIQNEPFSKGIAAIHPKLFISPDIFKYHGYDGSLESWSSLGSWIYKLLEGRNDFSLQTKAIVDSIKKESLNNFETAKKIYEYVQSKTRYVSIQLGIGGFRPFSAMEVDKTGYGDCKALTNYTKSLLDYAGIPSYYTIINGGDYANEIITDYVSIDQMNHVILCIPFDNDTIWAECTNQYIPFGYLGLFTDNRFALIVSSDGGKLVKTKKYNLNENTQIRKISAQIDNTGIINTRISTNYAGLQYDFLSNQLYLKKQEQKDNLLKNIKLENFILNDFRYSEYKNLNPMVIEEIDLQINNYISIVGDRMIFPLTILDPQNYVPSKVNNRKTDVAIRFSYFDQDSIIYDIPDKFIVEFTPGPVLIESKFGKYSSYSEVRDNKIFFNRKIERYEGVYPPESYDELIAFYKQIVKADNQKAILIKSL